MKGIAIVLLIILSGLPAGCGLPFMLVRAGYDRAAGPPTDPTGRGGCDYRDEINRQSGPKAGIVTLVEEPIFDPIPAVLVASWCGQTTVCDSAPSEKQRYFIYQGEPEACAAYSEQLAETKQRAEEESVRQLLAESPAQSEQGLRHDLEVVATLTPAQLQAIRDTGNQVTLTDEETAALKSMTSDQWHAVTQVAAFDQWLETKLKEARQEREGEEDRARLALYQNLTAQAATRQAAAAEWQAAAQWRQQQCLRLISAGLQCY